jgi:hypothetical protein
MATAVISASEGMHYLHGIAPGINITSYNYCFTYFTGLAILGMESQRLLQ